MTHVLFSIHCSSPKITNGSLSVAECSAPHPRPLARLRERGEVVILNISGQKTPADVQNFRPFSQMPAKSVDKVLIMFLETFLPRNRRMEIELLLPAHHSPYIDPQPEASQQEDRPKNSEQGRGFFHRSRGGCHHGLYLCPEININGVTCHHGDA